MNDNLVRLRELTDHLSAPFENLASKKSYVEVGCEKGGPLLVFGLYKNGNVAVARVFGVAGSIMAYHHHEETEVAAVYKGCLVFEFEDGETRAIGQRETITIPPKRSHRVTWTEDSWATAITMPAAEGFPDGRES